MKAIQVPILGRELIEGGFRWHIGDGEEVDITRDGLILRPKLFTLIEPPPTGNEISGTETPQRGMGYRAGLSHVLNRRCGSDLDDLMQKAKSRGQTHMALLRR